MPDGHDEELALIFQEMRKASGLGLESLAQQLATTPRTLQRFEDGAILSLPQWSETTRLITEYAGMLGLDGQPILRRIEAQLRTIAASGAVSDPDSNPAPGQGTLADELPPPEAPEAPAPTAMPPAPPPETQTPPPSQPPPPRAPEPPVPDAPPPPVSTEPDRQGQTSDMSAHGVPPQPAHLQTSSPVAPPPQASPAPPVGKADSGSPPPDEDDPPFVPEKRRAPDEPAWSTSTTPEPGRELAVPPEPARAPSSPLSRARPVEPQADDAVAVPPWRVSDAQTDAPPLPDRDGVDASYDEGPRDLDADDGRWPEELQRFDPDAEDDAARARRFGVLRAHPLAAIFGSIAVLLVLIVLFAPGVIRSGLMALPDPVPAVVKSVWSSGEQAGQPGAPNVIDSDDPRSRKADKLTGPGIVGQ